MNRYRTGTYVIVDSAKNPYVTYFFILIALFCYQEEVLKLVLLALEEGSALSRYRTVKLVLLINFILQQLGSLHFKILLSLDEKISLFSAFSPKYLPSL